MADNSVFIAGIAQGALGEALSDVPPWATEKTAGDIVEWLKKSYGKQSALLAQAIKCCNGAGGALSTKAAEAELDKLERTTRNQNIEANKALKDSKAKRDADRQSLLGGKKLQNLGEKVNYIMSGLAIAGVKVTGVMSEYIDVYDSMYKSGINVMNGNDSTRNGLEALNQTVLLTGLKLQTLQEIAEKYSSSINAAGFQKFAKATALSTTRLESLGFSAKEGAELIASMMEAEMGFSDIRGKSAKDIAEDAVKLGSQFGRLSQTMGISRQQLLDNMKTTAKSADSSLVAAKWGADAAENVAKTAAGIKDTNLREAFTKMAAAADPVFTQVYKDLQSSGLGAVADQMGQISRDMRTADPVEIAKRIDELQKSIPRGGIAGLQEQIAGGNTSANAAAEVVAGLQQQGRIVSQATDIQQQAATNTERSIAAFQTQTEKLSATLQAAFFPTIEQLDLATSALRAFNNATFGAIGAIDAEVRSWIGAGVVVAGFIAGLVLARGALTTFASLFGIESAATTAATKSLGGGLMSAIKSLGILAAAFAAMVAVVAGVDAIFGAFGVGGKPIDQKQDDANWDRMTALQKAESGLARGVEKIGSLLFMDNLANEAAADRIRKETEYFAKKDGKSKENQSDSETARLAARVSTQDKVTPTTISVPTAPMASTINSPSSVSTPQPTPEVAAGVMPEDGSRSGGPAIPKPGANADINNLLSYQGSVLERILLSTNDLVSVNKDILRYARNNV